MADDLSSFLKELKSVSTAMKDMVKDARDIRAALNGSLAGGSKTLGTSGKQMMSMASIMTGPGKSMAAFGVNAPAYDASKNGGMYGPDNRNVRVASAKFSGVDGRDTLTGLNQNAFAKMTGGVFRSMGMGEMRINRDATGLNKQDVYFNQQVAEAARTEQFNRSALGRSMSLAQGNWRGAFTGANTRDNRQMFDSLPTYNQNLISSSMPTPQDSLKLMSGVQNALNTFMPSVSDAMGRATGYYGATLAGGNRISRSQTIAATFNTLNKIGGVSSVGSDAAVAQLLASKGMTASEDPNSTYQQTMRTIGHAARYLNIGNEESAASVERLTSGQGAGAMLKNFGIYTADLTTGKEKTQGQIFEELAQRLTAGRRSATVEQTQASIRRGALGATINSFFQGDEAGAQMFKQYMIDRAGGKSMDLSNEKAMTSLYGGQFDNNRNPLNAQLSQTSAQTEALGMAQDEYIKGMEAATGTLTALAKAAGSVASVMGMPNAMIQNIMGNRQVQGLTAGAEAVTGYASKGIAAMQEAIIGGEYDTPWGAAVSAATVGTIAGGLAVGAAPALGSLAAQTLLGLGSKATSSGSGGDGTSDLTGMLTSGVGSNGSVTGTSSSSTSGGLTGSVADTSGMATSLYSGVKTGWTFNSTTDAGTQHKAIDFWLSDGSPVKAIADGVVTQAVKDKPDKSTYKAGSSDRSLGNFVQIYHQGGYISVYGHLKTVVVDNGASVKKGQLIGYSGTSGFAQGPHLHLKVIKVAGPDANPNGGTPVDPSTVSVAQLVGNKTSTGMPIDSSSGSTTGATLSSAMSAALTPSAAAQSAISSLAGLSSGDPAQIRAALSSLTANMGVSLGGSSYTGAYTSALGSSVGTSTAAALVGQQSAAATSGAKTVNITLNLPSTSQSEAEKFAVLVKQYLDDNTLQSNTASR